MRHLVVIAGLVALAGCTETTSTAKKAPAAAAGGATATASGVQPAGPPVDCLSLPTISESRVVDDSTIDFYTGAGGTVYRNHLPNSCPQLGFERAFSYSTSLSQLCSVDTITVISQGGGVRRGATCGLGQFQPVTGAPR
jgi:hypothetical protein